MGLFDFLFGGNTKRKAHVEQSYIWIVQHAKLDGIRDQLHQVSDAFAILLVAHFEDTLADLQGIAAEYDGPIPLRAMLAENLNTNQRTLAGLSSSGAGLDDPTGGENTLDLIVAEYHPLYSADENTLEFAEAVPCRCRVYVHCSLDDLLFSLFMGSARDMLIRLGMKENDAIESEMIQRRTRQAQKKLEAGIPNPQPARTTEEWAALNLQDLKK